MKLGEIHPYEKNPRNNEKAVDKVVKSIKEYGFRQPIVVDENMVIIVGHARYQASKKLELKEVPVHIATNLTRQQVKGLRIADNKAHEYSEWNEELLKQELKELAGLEFDMSLTCFDDIEIESLFAEPEDDTTSDDKIPEIPVDPITKKGDMWILGKFVYCPKCKTIHYLK